jgi:hypothetical protein
MKTKTSVFVTGLIMLSLLTGACAPGTPEPTPTLSVDAVQTIAVATFSGGLTQTAIAAPTNTATSTPAPTISVSTLANVTPFGTSVGGSTPVASCNSMAFVNDVTIPDNTPMTPGQTFTKTWKVVNNGTCAWDAGFKFAFTGGDAMSGATYTLPQNVPVNSQIDISVAMTAPADKTGSIRGNWRMSTAAGQFFGDEVYVMIMVGGTTGTATNTGVPATSTFTPEPSATPTTPVP